MNELFFVHPERWWFLLVPLVLLVLGLTGFARQRRGREAYGDLAGHPVLVEDAQPVGRPMTLVLQVLGLLCIALAALEPAFGWTVAKVERRGIEIVVCLDTSRSMLAEDLAPSRLERAKRDLRALLPELRGDRIALIAFAGGSRVVCPLTHDLGAFESLLDQVDTQTARRGGTDLGSAIRAALALLSADGAASQTILLLTDGEDLEGQARKEADLVRARGVRLHAIGYGSPRGAKIPNPDARGGASSFVVDESGNDVVTRLDAEGLRSVATACSGAYLAAEDAPLPVLEVFEKRVRPLAQRSFEAEDRRRPRSRFQLVLIPGLLLLLLSLFFAERSRASVIRS